MIIIGYGQLLAGVLLLFSAGVMWADGNILLPIVNGVFGFMFLWDSIERDDDDDDHFDGSVLLVR